jgi:hypothetical protein
MPAAERADEPERQPDGAASSSAAPIRGSRNFSDGMIYSPAMANEFLLDLAGRLRNFRLPYSRGLVPVFEAIVNSLHAIGEKAAGDGRIIV